MLIRTDYKKEIKNTGWVNEHVSEVFDDATEMLSENAVVFGGAIRDTLAMQKLEGDIDISVTMYEYKEVISKFQKNVKWIPYSKKLQKGILVSKSISSISAYKKWLPKLSDILSFMHMNGCIAQVISVNTKDPYSMIRDVDIVCCGVLMSRDGQVFEIIEGAYEDCVTKVLRLNKTKSITNINETPARIDKLVERGWKSLITKKQLDRVIARYKKVTDVKPKEPLKRVTNFSSKHNTPRGVLKSYGILGHSELSEATITINNNEPIAYMEPPLYQYAIAPDGNALDSNTVIGRVVDSGIDVDTIVVSNNVIQSSSIPDSVSEEGDILQTTHKTISMIDEGLTKDAINSIRLKMEKAFPKTISMIDEGLTKDAIDSIRLKMEKAFPKLSGTTADMPELSPKGKNNMPELNGTTISTPELRETIPEENRAEPAQSGSFDVYAESARLWNAYSAEEDVEDPHRIKRVKENYKDLTVSDSYGVQGCAKVSGEQVFTKILKPKQKKKHTWKMGKTH